MASSYTHCTEVMALWTFFMELWFISQNSLAGITHRKRGASSRGELHRTAALLKTPRSWLHSIAWGQFHNLFPPQGLIRLTPFNFLSWAEGLTACFLMAFSKFISWKVFLKALYTCLRQLLTTWLGCQDWTEERRNYSSNLELGWHKHMCI